MTTMTTKYRSDLDRADKIFLVGALVFALSVLAFAMFNRVDDKPENPVGTNCFRNQYESHMRLPCSYFPEAEEVA